MILLASSNIIYQKAVLLKAFILIHKGRSDGEAVSGNFLLVSAKSLYEFLPVSRARLSAKVNPDNPGSFSLPLL
jgi:hypothetical protein